MFQVNKKVLAIRCQVTAFGYFMCKKSYQLSAVSYQPRGGPSLFIDGGRRTALYASLFLKADCLWLFHLL
jgi:hypothetical protein